MSRSHLTRKNRAIFLLDENINRHIAPFLEQQHIVLFSPKGISDEKLITFAVGKNALLITLDKDFTNSDRYKPTKEYGIVVVRIHPPSKDALIGSLERMFHNRQITDLYGTITIISKEGIMYIH